jgi:DNA polymerase IV
MILTPNQTIAHMDLDCFFVSVSRLENSKLIGKPVLVGGEERGVVAACSYEARKFGIHSAMPMRTAKRLCPEAIIVRGDYEKYSQLSDEVTQMIRESVPLYERSSIDEFYMDLSGMDQFFGCYKWATELRQKVMHETGLPISLGMSKNKTVSKVATDEAKPNGQMQINFGKEKEFLAPLSIKKIPMIGDKTYHLLRNMGVEKVLTLQQMPVELLQNVLGENGISIWKKANGIDNTPVIPYSEQKSLSSEETFVQDTIDVQELKNILITMTEKLCFRLRTENKLTACITVKIRYSNFDTHNIQCKIPYTNCDHHIITRVKELFDKLFNRRMLIRLVGVKFSHLVYGGYQVHLFEDSEAILKLYSAMDRMRILYGADKVQRAVATKFSPRTFNPFNGIAKASTDVEMSENEREYLLVINPPIAIRNEVKRIKEEFSKDYDYPRAEKTQPHITLASFRLDESFEENIVKALDELCQFQEPIEVRLKNFNSFPSHTIFIDVINYSAIIDLVKSIKIKLNLPRGTKKHFSFRPHLTVARGLSEEKFKKAITEFQFSDFNASFIASNMTLMKRKDEYDRCLVIKEFEWYKLYNNKKCELPQEAVFV